MASSLEDILVNVNNVKKNKCEGSLFLMTQRLAWMPAGKNNFTVSYNYSDIKLQKISPDTKEKVQLQVVLEAGGASTFHFNNSGGKPAQMKDREAVKTLLQEMINKFKKNLSSELELKSVILEENPSMFELYKSLVVSGKLSSLEFWASRSNKIKPNKVPDQEIGVSSGFLGEIQGHADGCNGIKYNLTPDIINSIFKTYPAVERKHGQLVPEWTSEQQFWYEFFQSHYFHRDRTNISEKEIFADCAQLDEEALRTELKRREGPHLMDFGTLYNNCLHDDNVNDGDDSDVAGTSANSSLIRRFNQHSTMVLKSTLANNNNNNDNNDNNNNNNDINNANNNNDDDNNKTKDNIKNKNRENFSNNVNDINAVNNVNDINAVNNVNDINAVNNVNDNIKRSLNDIENQECGTNSSNAGHPSASSIHALKHKRGLESDGVYNTETGHTAAKLSLSKTEAYLHGPIPRDSMTYNTSDELQTASQLFKESVRSWQPAPLSQILTNTSALTVLSELAPSGCLMQHASAAPHVPGHTVLPADMREEFRLLQLTLCELLRHFWACFPITDKSFENKVVRMAECLKEFEQAQLKQFHEKLLENHLPVDETTGNIAKMLEKAHAKYSAWLNRKSSKRT